MNLKTVKNLERLDDREELEEMDELEDGKKLRGLNEVEDKELRGLDETENYEGLEGLGGFEDKELGGLDGIEDEEVRDCENCENSTSPLFQSLFVDRTVVAKKKCALPASRGKNEEIDSSNSRSGPLLIQCYLLI